jgi:hypothetical protein
VDRLRLNRIATTTFSPVSSSSLRISRLHQSRVWRKQWAFRSKRISVLAPLLVAGYSILAVLDASQARGDVGDLGPPPAEPEIRQTLIDFYNAGSPLGSTVDVQFAGPILVGQPTEHANPPLRPWCVRCGYPDQGLSPMYPVMALVTVTARHGVASSALAPSTVVESKTTYSGTSCPGVAGSQYCPAYYFYRDGQGSWHVA